MCSLVDWLHRIGLGEYAARFADNDIDFSILRDLSDQDLRDLGMASLGHRRKLLHAVAELSATLATPDAPSPIDPPRAEATERRQLTVMFCDLVGSTELSTRLDPEDLRTVIGAYNSVAAATVRRFHGFVAKYLGDGILVYFGYPNARENDTEEAVRCALALVTEISALAPHADVSLAIRIGIATGLVVVGDITGGEPGILGETPNLAARLQALALPNTVVIADGTRRLLGGLFTCEDLGAQALKGFAEALRAWRVVGESLIQSRFEALHSGATALVGRKEEIEILERLWQLAKTGEGQAVLLSGEPGIGKSRLAVALVDALRSEPHAALQYFCSPHHQDSALHPVIAYLESAAGFEYSDAPELRFGKLEALITANSMAAEDVALFAELLSLPLSDRYAPLQFSPQRKKEKTLDALIRYLASVAESRPVLLIFEDIHWIDPTSRELLDLLIKGIEHLPILVIATFRPEFQSPWSGLSHETNLALTRLAREDSATLVRQIERDTTALPDEVVQQIVERSDGVPLFLEEVTKAMREASAGASWAKNGILEHAVPATLHASLLARLDRIGATAKEIAQVGAAIGREFSYELLAATLQRSPSYVNEALTRLVEAALIFQRGTLPEATFLFKHALVQDAAYSTLLRGARRNLHARIADALLAVDHADSVAPEIIALHMQSAERPTEAIAYWQRAGEQSVRRANNREAVAHFRRALSLLEAQPQASERWRTELAILSQLGPALMSVHGWAAAEVGEVVERAADVGRRLESSQELAPSIANLWIFHYASGRLDAAEKISDDLFRIARELNSPEVLLQAHHCAWPVRWGRGGLIDAVGHIDAGLALYDEERHAHHRFLYLGHDPAVCGLSIASQLHAMLGYPARARDAGDRALALARRLNHDPSLAHGLWFVVESQITCHDVAGVIVNTAELLKLAAQHGLLFPQAIGRVYRGWALASTGKDIAEGVALALEGTAQLERSGARVFLSRAYCSVAEAYLIVGQYAEGLEHVNKALHLASEIGDAFYSSRLFQTRAKLMQASGQADDAIEANWRQSLELARAQGAKMYELRAAIGLVCLWRRQGKRDDGSGLLTPICDWFTEGIDMPDLKEAKELLERRC